MVDELEDIQREILYVLRSLYVNTCVSSILFPDDRSISIFGRTVFLQHRRGGNDFGNVVNPEEKYRSENHLRKQ